jgi:hypothetical protein
VASFVGGGLWVEADDGTTPRPGDDQDGGSSVLRLPNSTSTISREGDVVAELASSQQQEDAAAYRQHLLQLQLQHIIAVEVLKREPGLATLAAMAEQPQGSQHH